MICQFFANGFEELEAIAPIDLLRRAGVEAQTVSLEKSRTVTGSHSIPITCDITASELELTQCDGVILPGGPGCTALSRHPQALAAIELAVQQGLLLAAICAAPSVLAFVPSVNECFVPLR